MTLKKIKKKYNFHIFFYPCFFVTETEKDVEASRHAGGASGEEGPHGRGCCSLSETIRGRALRAGLPEGQAVEPAAEPVAVYPHALLQPAAEPGAHRGHQYLWRL